MADYRYLFCDALLGTLLDELPLDCQSFSQQISGVGTLTGTLALGDIGPAVNWQAATLPNRTAVMVLRGDNPDPVWGGIIRKRRPVSGGTQAEISADTLEGWLANQELWTDLTYGSATDVFTIVRGIVDQVQAVNGGNMRLAYGANLAGQTTTVTYLGKGSTKALDAINRLAEASPGFEYTIAWARTGNTFTPTLTLAAPGLNTTLDPILLEFPGNLADYGFDEDGPSAANMVTGVGADTAGTPILARASDSTGQLAAGWPTWYGQQQFKTETDATRLAARTSTAMQAGLADYVVPTATLRSDAALHLGDFPLGVPARLRATSLYHPAGADGRPGLDVTRRVTGWTVTPAAVEKVTLALASTTGKVMQPAVQRKSTDQRLADLDRRVRELSTQ